MRRSLPATSRATSRPAATPQFDTDSRSPISPYAPLPPRLTSARSFGISAAAQRQQQAEPSSGFGFSTAASASQPSFASSPASEPYSSGLPQFPSSANKRGRKHANNTSLFGERRQQAFPSPQSNIPSYAVISFVEHLLPLAIQNMLLIQTLQRRLHHRHPNDADYLAYDERINSQLADIKHMLQGGDITDNTLTLTADANIPMLLEFIEQRSRGAMYSEYQTLLKAIDQEEARQRDEMTRYNAHQNAPY